MTGTRRGGWALTGARAITGAAVAAGAVVAVVLAVAAPWPHVAHAPVAIVAAPTPADSLSVCDGGVFAAGRDAEHADELTVAAAPVPVAAADGSTPEERELASPDVQGDATAPTFVAAPEGGAATSVAAATSATLSDPDLSGFTADACRSPQFESWLVGGTTTTGSSDLLVISNPGDVAAAVDITVYGATGATVPPGGAGVTIAARTQRVLPVAGLALGEESPVLRITASSAPVRASLQSSLVRTLVPGGVDQQSAVAAPAETQVIPGVVVTAPPGESGASNAATILRVLAPRGAGQATVTVTAIGGSAPAIPPSEVPLVAGVPSELELSGLPVGAYVATVTAPQPVVAAVWQATGFGAGSDFAWLAAAPALVGPTLTAVPAGPSPTLQLANPGAAEATVRLHAVSGNGSDRTIVVPAGGSAAIALTTLTVWAVDPGDAPDVHAQVTFSSPNAIAGFAVWPSDAAAAAVRVYP